MIPIKCLFYAPQFLLLGTSGSPPSLHFLDLAGPVSRLSPLPLSDRFSISNVHFLLCSVVEGEAITPRPLGFPPLFSATPVARDLPAIVGYPFSFPSSRNPKISVNPPRPYRPHFGDPFFNNSYLRGLLSSSAPLLPSLRPHHSLFQSRGLDSNLFFPLPLPTCFFYAESHSTSPPPFIKPCPSGELPRHPHSEPLFPSRRSAILLFFFFAASLSLSFLRSVNQRASIQHHLSSPGDRPVGSSSRAYSTCNPNHSPRTGGGFAQHPP